VTKPLTKVRICPTCDVGFKSSQVIENGKPGWRCPAGHFHSVYEMARHADGKSIRVGRPGPKPEKSAMAERRRTVEANKYGHGKAELLALLWVAAYEKVMDQLPASTSRLLVEGVMAQAYRASQALLESGR
jgi:hypothetical protein